MQGGGCLYTTVRSSSSPGALEYAVGLLCAGQLVVFATDTVYGVGCDPWNVQAIQRLFWAKGRSESMAIPVLLARPEDVWQVARDVPTAFDSLTSHFWPGGLTIVVPRRPELPDVLCAGGNTVAVRMPNHPVALALAKGLGGVLAATSANRSGRPSPRTAQEALADLRDRVALVLDGGECPGGVSSSVVDLVSSPPVLLRRGALSQDVLRQVLPDIRFRDDC